MVARPPSPSPVADVDPVAKATTTSTNKQLVTRKIDGNVYQLPADKPLYSAHGKWAWANGHEIISGDKGTRLGDGLEGYVNLKVGMIDEKVIVYISKMTSVWDNLRLFFSSLYLMASSKYLRPLQGDCVPWIIGVHHCLGGRLGVAQDLPHPTGWREADMFLEESQKEAIIAAYQKMHDQGVAHGDVEYRHMLIGDDGKVTIIDFGLSAVVNLDEWALKVGLGGCSRLTLRNEMRKVKFMLDWKDSRETEFRLAKLRHAREERDRAATATVMKDQTKFYVRIEVPKEPMSEEEEKTNPDGGLRLCDLNLWSYGDKWVAHHFEVDRSAYSAKLKKTPIPRTQVPAGETTESANPVVPSTHTPGEPVPVPAPASATQTIPTGSASATDVLTPTVPSLEESSLQVEEAKEPDTEQKNGDAEPTKAVPTSHSKAGENDRPVRKSPLEDESEQGLKNVNEERTVAAPLGYKNVSNSEKPPLEDEPMNEQNGVVDEERTVAAPLGYENVSDSEGPLRKPPLEDEPMNGVVDQERTVVAPLGYENVSDSEGPLRKRPVEDEPMNEQNGAVNAESTKTALLRYGKAGENNVPARKRPFEEEPEKEKAEEQEDKAKPRKRVPLRNTKAGHSSEPARLTSLEVRSEVSKEQNNARLSRTKAISLKYDQSDRIEPAKKRRRTTDASMAPALTPLPVGSQRNDSDNSSSESTGESTSTSTSSESDEDDPMRVPLLDDDAADPTPYELNPEACAFLRSEAARGLARFTTAKMRVLPMERQLDLENHDLEKRRSELLRIMLMLPREDRTTLWTNMGQPDARTLLGLVPETPGPSRSTRNLIKIQTRLAQIEAAAASQANGTNELTRDSDPGFLAVQKVQAKTGSKQKLREQLGIEQKLERLAMPPPPPPPPLPALVPKTSPPEKVETPKSSSASNMPSRASSSRGKASQEGSTSQTGPSQSRSISAAQLAITSRIYSEGMKKALADAHKANPNGVFSVTVPKEILALEAKSMRKYTIPEGPSDTQPGRNLARTPAAFYDLESMEDMTLTLIKTAKESKAKRKREAVDFESDDDKLVPISDVESPDAKRRRTKASDLS